jgi:hypothetical protein
MLPDGSTSLHGANPIHVWNTKRQPWVAALSHQDPREKDISRRKEPTVWFADTEADARAKMLIYLLEKKLLDMNKAA